ncbi:ankyrin repeat domain-containing protein [Thalassotalea sp. G20_0]|uniref:ankyrin repeat domain-containing protein n=1 Tax=Thalassotalea sp. G20_0 TaxID=2821093 RepID=UPI001ADBD0B1|nr:ankyrin repeat domain-containing protein [Thalassotalea sp. G20_0]MBO9494942.1 ankyrin repeat domain-containing protein [Thalassotalea sp. G20_0]
MQPVLPLIRLDGGNVLDDDSPYCESMMINACRTGDLQTLNMLLAQDKTLANRAYHSVLTGHPEYPLTVAIKYGRYGCVRALIGCGADVNAADHDGETSLHIVARQHRTDDFEMLIRAGTNINLVLHTAIKENNPGEQICAS